MAAMEANTAKLNFEVEKTNEIDYTKYNENEAALKTVPTRNMLLMKISKGITASKKISEIQNRTEDVLAASERPSYIAYDIDFGLEKRAYTSLQLDKYLKEIVLTKDNGKTPVLDAVILDDGRVQYSNDDTANTAAMLSVSVNKGVQGFHYIQMESSYFDDLTVNLKYRIDVINESEADWTSKWASEKYTTKELVDKAEELEGNYTTKITPLRTGEGIEYGKYAGFYYYTNRSIEGKKEFLYKNPEVGSSTAEEVEYEDKVVKTTVDQLVEYVDKDTTISTSSTNMNKNNAWMNDFNKVDTNGNAQKYTVGEIYEMRGLLSSGRTKKDDNDLGSYTMGTKGANKEASLKGAKLIISDDNPLVSDVANRIAISSTDTIKHKDKLEMKVLNRDSRGVKVATTSGEVGYQNENKEVQKDVYAYEYQEGKEVKKKNLFNPLMTEELEPISYAENFSGKKAKAIGRIEVDTKTTIDNTTQAGNMKYANLSEILVYSNSVGRRTFMANSNANEDSAKDNTILDEEKSANKEISVQNNNEEVKQNVLAPIKTINKTTGNTPDVRATIPGNALEMVKYEAAKGATVEEELFWLAGHARNEARAVTDELSEIDTDATDYITFTEPTGLSHKSEKLRAIFKILIATIILLILGILGVTGKIVYDKKKKTF